MLGLKKLLLVYGIKLLKSSQVVGLRNFLDLDLDRDPQRSGIFGRIRIYSRLEVDDFLSFKFFENII
jgi:hypothetical protein